MTQETLSHLPCHHRSPTWPQLTGSDGGSSSPRYFCGRPAKLHLSEVSSERQRNQYCSDLFSGLQLFLICTFFSRYLSESFVSVPTSELGSVTQMCLMVCACLSSPFGRRSTFNFLLHLFRLIPPKRRRGRTEDVALVPTRASSGLG